MKSPDWRQACFDKLQIIYYVQGGAGSVVLEGFNFKTNPFLEGKFFTSEKREGVKSFDTATAV